MPALNLLRVETDKVFQIAAIYVHPRYQDALDQPHDIALLRLNREAQSPVLALLASDANRHVQAVQVAGFGRTAEGASLSYNALRSRYVVVAGSPILLATNVLAEDTSSRVYSEFNPQTQLCFGLPTGGQDSCQGDSGGPLVERGLDGAATLLGIVSFARGCGRAEAPGVYTSVASHISWLEQVMAARPQKLLSTQVLPFRSRARPLGGCRCRCPLLG